MCGPHIRAEPLACLLEAEKVSRVNGKELEGEIIDARDLGLSADVGVLARAFR